MATKKGVRRKPASAPTPEVPPKPEVPAVNMATVYLHPRATAATTIAYAVGADAPTLETAQGLFDELGRLVEGIGKGDMARVESMLISQAHALDTIFHRYTRAALSNVGQYRDSATKYMHAALAAQANCRATLEALARLKQPRQATFVKQANIAHGPQQVNNGTAHAEKGAPAAALPPPTDEPWLSPATALEVPKGAVCQKACDSQERTG